MSSQRQQTPGAVQQAMAVALGWTTLEVSPLVEPLVGRGKHLALYHWDGSPGALFGPVLAVAGLAWTAALLLLLLASLWPRWRAPVWAALLCLLTLPLCTLISVVAHLPLGFRVPPLSVEFLVLLALLAGAQMRFPARFARAIATVSKGLMVLAFSGALAVLQMGWFWWSARGLNEPRPLHPALTSTSAVGSAGRVVWIVFDELSYEQLFTRRAAGLPLPAFDALAAESTVFTQVQPAGPRTDLVMPALLSGQPVAEIRASADGALWTRSTPKAQWQAFAEQNTVFADALAAGKGTGLAGWYNPYCRLLPTVLQRCFWTLGSAADNGLASYGTFRSNLLVALRSLLANSGRQMVSPALAHRDAQAAAEATGHLEDYQQLAAASDALLHDPSMAFVLLHLPVPHPEGIYDRRTGQFSIAHTGYLDNLALADRALAQIRQTMEQAGTWDDATVLVMGDHSWRVHTMWRVDDPRWTPEDEQASAGGRFDPRPAYLLKLPGQHRAAHIDQRFAALRTRSLLDALWAHAVHTPEDLAAWVQR